MSSFGLLAYANRIRDRLNLALVSELAEGVPRDAENCPVARTVGHMVYVTPMAVWRSRAHYDQEMEPLLWATVGEKSSVLKYDRETK